MKKLSINFNNTFSPNRLLMSKLLEYLSNNNNCTLEDIKSNTGITNGKSTGKVQPYLNYLAGMGLIEYELKNSLFSPKLTLFGKEVLKEDPQFSLNLTQWVCHSFMCDKTYGCDIWLTFFEDWKKSEVRKISQLEKIYNIKKSKYTPLLSMYNNEEEFSSSRIIYSSDNEKQEYHRNSAPIYLENFPAYGALIVHYLLNYFDKDQVSINEFDEKIGFSNIFGWDSAELEMIINAVASLGYIKISSQLDPKCLQALVPEEFVWKMLYSELF